LAVALEVVVVAIPPSAGHLNHWHTRLQQPPSNQRVLAEISRAVLLAYRLRLAVEIEQGIRLHQAAHAGIGAVVAFDLRGLTLAVELLAEPAPQVFALVMLRRGEPLGQVDVLWPQRVLEMHGRVGP